LYLPKSDEKKEGIIEEIGNQKETNLKKGEKVMYSGYSNEEIEMEGEKFIIVDLKDIIAKIE
jgi:chaperonin GroES